MKLINMRDSSESENIFNVIYNFGERFRAGNSIMLTKMHYSLYFAKHCKVGKY